MRVAIPLSEDGVARVLDTSTRLLIIDLNDDNCSERAEVPTFVRSPENRAREFASLGIDVLLCEEVSRVLAARIREQGIEIESPVPTNVDDAIFHVVRHHRPIRRSRQTSAA